jgi:hypothetical protein
MLPDIYYYNSTCELAIANGDINYQPPKLLKEFENELGVLPLYFAKKNDVILLNDLPPASFTDSLANAGFVIPNLVNIEDAKQNVDLVSSPKNFLFPWGWSPAAHKELGIFKNSCSSIFKKSPVYKWSEKQKQIYSKKTGVEVFERLLKRNEKEWLPLVSELPEVCTSHSSIEKLQKRWGRVVVKSPWSSSGRGLQFLREGEYNKTNSQVISGFLKQQGYVIVSPWHDKLTDLSFHFYTKGNGEVDYCGQAVFITDKAGKYQGNYILPQPKSINNELKEFLKDKVPEVEKMLKTAIEESLLSSSYYGWMGVDAIVYEDENNNLKINPCLEINCRFNMGAMTLKLREHIAKGSYGEWRVSYGEKGNFARESKELQQKYPVVMEAGKIKEGYLALSPQWGDGCFGVWMQVRN